MINLDRLQAQLLNSPIHIKDNPLYQVITQLIKAEKELQTAFNNINGAVTNITNNVVEEGIQPVVLFGDDAGSSDPIILIPGKDGRDGRDGLRGASGENGLDGNDSYIPGPQGLQGLRGLDGIPGLDGLDGEPSYTSGLSGRDGKDGRPGLDGLDGLDGSDSLIPGPAGKNSRDGLCIPGMDGLDGQDGFGWPGPAGSGSGSSGFTEQDTTSTGTQNDFSLSAAQTYLRSNNASAVTFTGFTISGAAPSEGNIVIIDNIGTSTIKISYQTGSSAANQIITASTNGQIIGAGGRLICVYDGTSDRWRGTVINTGAPIPVTYASGNFTGSGSLTWTVDSADQSNFTYQQNGALLTVRASIVDSSTGGTASNELRIAIPGGFVSKTGKTQKGNLIQGIDAGVTNVAVSPQVTTAGTFIRHDKNDGTNWSNAAANNTYIFTDFTFEVD